MTIRPKPVAALGALAALLSLYACAEKEAPVRSTLELMDDPVMLQVVLARCNESGAVHDRECRNAREAVERLAAEESEHEREQRQAMVQAEFEKAREERRRRDELERRKGEAQQQVDPYTMPLIKEAEAAPMQGSAQPPPRSPST